MRRKDKRWQPGSFVVGYEDSLLRGTKVSLLRGFDQRLATLTPFKVFLIFAAMRLPIATAKTNPLKLCRHELTRH